MRRARPGGFTILELLIAALIALFICGVGVSLIAGAVQARGEAQVRLRAASSARLFFELLERDLAGAFTTSSGWYRRGHLAEAVSGAEGVCIRLATTSDARTAAGDTEFLAVRYYVAAGRLHRETEANAAFAADGVAPALDSALCLEARLLHAEFARWDADAKRFVAPGGAPATHLLVQLSFLDPNEKLAPADRVRLYTKYLPIPDAVKE